MAGSFECVTNVSHNGRLYGRGRVIELDDDAAERLISLGAIRPAEAASQPADTDDSAENAVDEPRPPAQSEPKSAFVDYAIDHLGLDRDGAEAMSKAELVELTRQ